jgi:carboxypeptidase PM20D1
MRKILKISAVLVVAILGIMLIRTFSAKSRQIDVSPAEKAEFNENAALEHLASALRIETISYDDPSKLDGLEFTKFHDFLRSTFPLVHSQLALEKVNEYSLLFHWSGAERDLAPVVLMAHMDVVPAEGASWKHPPFGGNTADGYVWGRGTLDDKSCVTSQLEAVEYLLEQGFRPKRTIYLAYGHDEETGGRGAAAIVHLLKSRGVQPEIVVDEGGAILNSIIPGVLVPTAMIGTSEKGYATFDLTVEDVGGHSSAPPKNTAIGVLSKAVQTLEENPMPAKLQGSAADMLDYLGPELPFISRFVLSNRWFFQPFLVFALSRINVANAMVRTTTAVTMIHGGVKENVLPDRVTATVNFRIRPGDTIDDVREHILKTIANDRIQITRRPQGMNPSPVSPSDSPQFELLHRTIRQVFPNTIVVPGIVIGATDARHYTEISRNVFRFAPFSVTTEDFRGVHGIDERIRIESYMDMVHFYIQLLRNSTV